MLLPSSGSGRLWEKYLSKRSLIKHTCSRFDKLIMLWTLNRSSRPELFWIKGVLKICSKFTGGHPCRSVISIKLQSNFVETTPRHGFSPVNLLHIFWTSFSKNTSGWLLLTEHTSKNIFTYIKTWSDIVSHGKFKVTM